MTEQKKHASPFSYEPPPEPEFEPVVLPVVVADVQVMRTLYGAPSVGDCPFCGEHNPRAEDEPCPHCGRVLKRQET